MKATLSQTLSSISCVQSIQWMRSTVSQLDLLCTSAKLHWPLSPPAARHAACDAASDAKPAVDPLAGCRGCATLLAAAAAARRRATATAAGYALQRRPRSYDLRPTRTQSGPCPCHAAVFIRTRRTAVPYRPRSVPEFLSHEVSHEAEYQVGSEYAD